MRRSIKSTSIFPRAAACSADINCANMLSAVTFRIGDPCLKRRVSPSASAATQVNRRRKCPHGDSTIQRRPTQSRYTNDIANAKEGWRWKTVNVWTAGAFRSAFEKQLICGIYFHSIVIVGVASKHALFSNANS